MTEFRGSLFMDHDASWLTFRVPPEHMIDKGLCLECMGPGVCHQAVIPVTSILDSGNYPARRLMLRD